MLRANAHPLSRISRGAWWTRWTWGSRETLFQTKPLSLHTSHINKTIQRNSHICSGRVLSVLLQSGHTWGKGMHEAIRDSVLGCKSSQPLFFLSTAQCLNGLYLQGEFRRKEQLNSFCSVNMICSFCGRRYLFLGTTWFVTEIWQPGIFTAKTSKLHFTGCGWNSREEWGGARGCGGGVRKGNKEPYHRARGAEEKS